MVAVADLTVIVPSRERPTQAGPLIQAFRATCTASTRLVFALDESDPTRQGYVDAAFQSGQNVSVIVTPSTTMVQALNAAVNALTGFMVGRPDGEFDTVAGFAVGFMGDDHCPRTVGWDAAYLEALRELGTGMVYGDDLLQGERIPTQVAMTADIVKALGYMAPPVLTHLYVDNFWKDLGEQSGCLRYLPDVEIEHRHPVARKAAWDAGYARVNDSAMYARDEQAYRAFHASGEFSTALTTVRALRGAA